MNWWQIIFNSAVTGSLYLIGAVGITMVYGLSRFPNFAHAELMTLGAYIGYLVSEQLGMPYPLTFVAAFLASGTVGVLSYIGIFKPLAARGATIIHLMIASIALGFIFRHIIQEAWGGSSLAYSVRWSYYEIGAVRTATIRLWLVGTAVGIAIFMHFVLSRTKIGKAIRATSSNPDLALSSGINVHRVTLFAWFVGSALAGIAGVFRASITRVYPMLGWDILLPTFAVTILGGIGSFYGAIAAAYIIGLAENIGVTLLAEAGVSTEYRMAIAFVILIITLIIRPQGLGRMFKGN